MLVFLKLIQHTAICDRTESVTPLKRQQEVSFSEIATVLGILLTIRLRVFTLTTIFTFTNKKKEPCVESFFGT
jgi:hypothetical protein